MSAPVVDEYLILHTPAGPHVWRLGQPADEMERVALMLTARAIVGFPTGDAWIDEGSDWSAMLVYGEPHPKLIAQTGQGIRDVAELHAADPALLASYETEHIAATKQAKVDAAKAALDALDDAQFAAVMADPTVATRSTVAPAAEL